MLRPVGVLAAILVAALLGAGLTFSRSTEGAADFRFVNGSEPRTLDPALLTGQAGSEAIRHKAEQIVSRVEQVRRVVNEVEIGSDVSFGEHSRDVALTAEVKLKLTNVDIPDFDSMRVKVVTERGSIYLMGLLTKEEAAAVTEVVRYISGVRRVVKVFEYL